MSLLALPLLLLAPQDAPQATAPTPAEELVLHDVTRVVDGDTIWIRRDGREEKLRLLSVDTEEKITGRPDNSGTKPETVFGQETTLWAQELFDGLARPGQPARVGLRFPEEREARDVFGRLLCHVILPDGRDFNLMLVELGKSPYFNKYGNSRIAHEAFVAAQERAREAELGIWNPATNRPSTPDAPSARRPYDQLLPWWQARADAIDAFRARRADAETPERWVDAERPEDLEVALTLCTFEPEMRVEVFGSIERFFDEKDGALTVLLRTGDRGNAVRVRLPRDRDAQLEALLRSSTEELRQNYLLVSGRLTRGPRGYRLTEAFDKSAWRLAGPEPVLPAR